MIVPIDDHLRIHYRPARRLGPVVFNCVNVMSRSLRMKNAFGTRCRLFAIDKESPKTIAKVRDLTFVELISFPHLPVGFVRHYWLTYFVLRSERAIEAIRSWFWNQTLLQFTPPRHWHVSLFDIPISWNNVISLWVLIYLPCTHWATIWMYSNNQILRMQNYDKVVALPWVWGRKTRSKKQTEAAKVCQNVRRRKRKRRSVGSKPEKKEKKGREEIADMKRRAQAKEKEQDEMAARKHQVEAEKEKLHQSAQVNTSQRSSRCICSGTEKVTFLYQVAVKQWQLWRHAFQLATTSIACFFSTTHLLVRNSKGHRLLFHPEVSVFFPLPLLETTVTRLEATQMMEYAGWAEPDTRQNYFLSMIFQWCISNHHQFIHYPVFSLYI